MIIEKTNKDIKSVLMEKKISKTQTVYYQITDHDQKIYIVAPGQNGAEFNKTDGFFSTFPGMQTYISLYGSGLLLMQKNDEAGEAKEFKVVRLNSLKQVNVPAGWGMSLVNTGNTYLVVLTMSVPAGKYFSPKPIIEKGGLVYFAIEKKGEIAFERNSNYNVHPQITSE